jgi:hypothetical protein
VDPEPTEKELSKIRNMKSFLGENISSPDKLELLVLIAYLSDRVGRLKNRNAEQEVVAILKQTKPYFTEYEVLEGIEKARQLSDLGN